MINNDVIAQEIKERRNETTKKRALKQTGPKNVKLTEIYFSQ